MITFQVAFLKFNAYKSSNLNSILYKPVIFSVEKQKPLQFFLSPRMSYTEAKYFDNIDKWN